jgi:hypothetical protein
MKLLVLYLALSLSACATSNAPNKPDYQHAPIEKINHVNE